MGADTGEVDIRELRLQVSGSEAADLAVEIAGEGRPFVWSHALLGSMAQDLGGGVLAWRELTDMASIIRYDARGHGRSQSTATAEDYSWQNQAGSLWEVIDQLIEEDVILGGASMGSGISLHAACLNPERVRGLVLVIPPRIWEWREGKAKGYRLTANIMRFSGGLPLKLLGRVPFRSSGDDFRKDSRGVMAQDLASADYRGIVGAMRGAALSDFPSRETLASLDIPTLILAWPDDDIHPVSVAEEVHQLLPNSTLEVAQSPGDPYDWSNTVRAFVESISR
jgi:pimeloyl-ACP methyl ester carboxylesterase